MCVTDDRVERSREVSGLSTGADESWTRRGARCCCLATTTHWTTTTTGRLLTKQQLICGHVSQTLTLLDPFNASCSKLLLFKEFSARVVSLWNLFQSFQKFVNYLCQSAVSKSSIAKWCCKISMVLTINSPDLYALTLCIMFRKNMLLLARLPGI